MGICTDGENFVNDTYVKALHRVFEIVTIRIQKQWLIFDVIFNCSSLKKELDQSLKVIHEISTKVCILSKLYYFQKQKVLNELIRNSYF